MKAKKWVVLIGFVAVIAVCLAVFWACSRGGGAPASTTSHTDVYETVSGDSNTVTVTVESEEEQ